MEILQNLTNITSNLTQEKTFNFFSPYIDNFKSYLSGQNIFLYYGIIIGVAWVLKLLLIGKVDKLSMVRHLLVWLLFILAILYLLGL